MPKWSLEYDQYKKVVEADFRSLFELLMEANNFDKMKELYLNAEEIADEFVEDYIKHDRQTAMDNGNLVAYMELNSFLGALKKTRTKNLRKKRK